MKKIISHLKKYILQGALAVIPIALIYLLIRFIYLSIDKTILNLVDDFIGIRPPGLGVLITLLVLYLLGVFASNLAGRWLFAKIEWLTDKIPFIKTTYQVGKQISSSLSIPEKQAFKKAVLVNFLKEDIYTIGFITGSLKDKNSDKQLFKVFIPTPPNPMSGTLVILEEHQLIDPGWTIDEAIRSIISAGIIGPEQIQFSKK